MQIVFAKPFLFDGKEYTELNLDFDSLTGRDFIRAETEAKAIASGFVPVLELSKPYQSVIAAKAAKVPVDMIMDLPGKEYTKVTMAVQDFLLG